MHKNKISFRAIVSEKGTWQIAASSYLQNCLTSVSFSDPFHMCDSQALFQFLSEENRGGCKAFSMDIKYLHYSLLHEGLLKRVKNCIKEQVQETFSLVSVVCLRRLF